MTVPQQRMYVCYVLENSVEKGKASAPTICYLGTHLLKFGHTLTSVTNSLM